MSTTLNYLNGFYCVSIDFCGVMCLFFYEFICLVDLMIKKLSLIYKI